MSRKISKRLSLSKVLNKPNTSHPIPLKERRDINFIRELSDNIRINDSHEEGKDEVKAEVEGSIISNTSSLKMIVPPYQSPPDAAGKRPSLK